MYPTRASLPAPTRLALLAALAAACTGAPEPAPPAAAPGALRGELVVHVLDFGPDRQHAVRHAIRLPDGRQRALRLPEAPDLPSGTPIEVRGRDEGNTLVVSDFRVLDPDPAGVEAHQGALVAGTKKPAKRWAFILLDVGKGVNYPKDKAQLGLFGEQPTSLRSYYKEVSYGLQELTGQVFGPFKFNATAAQLCDVEEMLERLLPIRAMIQGTFDQYLWYYGSQQNCEWAGVATLGSAARPTRDSIYNGDNGCVVLIQEPGHNFGMVHSSALRCQDAAGKPISIIGGGGGSCSHDEYGNPFDPMGSGCGHMNGVQKAYQGWLEGCNIVKVTSSGTFTLFPLEAPCNGVQVLQIPIPEPRLRTGSGKGVMTAYYLEHRTGVGWDARAKVPAGVYIVAAGEIRDARNAGNTNWLIDAHPDTEELDDAALSVGKQYVDPAPNGPKFTVISAGPDKAIIQVELQGSPASDDPGKGICSDDKPFEAPGPTTCAMVSTPDGGATVPPTRDAGATDPPVKRDAGSSTGRDADDNTSTPTPSRDAGAPADAKTPPKDPEEDPGTDPPGDDTPPPVGGCACHVGGTDGAPPAAALVALPLVMLLVRRRRRG